MSHGARPDPVNDARHIIPDLVFFFHQAAYAELWQVTIVKGATPC